MEKSLFFNCIYFIKFTNSVDRSISYLLYTFYVFKLMFLMYFRYYLTSYCSYFRSPIYRPDLYTFSIGICFRLCRICFKLCAGSFGLWVYMIHIANFVIANINQYFTVVDLFKGTAPYKTFTIWILLVKVV